MGEKKKILGGIINKLAGLPKTLLIGLSGIFALTVASILGTSITISDIIDYLTSGYINEFLIALAIILCFAQIFFAVIYLLRNLISQLVAFGSLLTGMIILAVGVALIIQYSAISIIMFIIGSIELLLGMVLSKLK
ncbi:MAG: hypothetical protein Q6363_004125 [Candidatus Njordarchaeota archaeon]